MLSDEVPGIAPPALIQRDPVHSQQLDFHDVFNGNMKWSSLKRYFIQWIKHPENAVYFIWLMFVVAGLLMIALLALGILDGVITGSERRDEWAEVVNQIVNALFMIMSLYQYPYVVHHTVHLCRWSQNDRVQLRTLYCKDGGVRPYERAHFTFVLLLLHSTCVSQFVQAALFWAYDRYTRPNWALITCIVIGTGTAVIAFIYTMTSPMGKRYENVPEMEPESEVQVLISIPEPVILPEPELKGGLSDCGDNLTVASCSDLSKFGVFEWNMERLGFGNMFVRIFVVILLCLAPMFLIFWATHLNIDKDSIVDNVAICRAVTVIWKRSILC